MDDLPEQIENNYLEQNPLPLGPRTFLEKCPFRIRFIFLHLKYRMQFQRKHLFKRRIQKDFSEIANLLAFDETNAFRNEICDEYKGMVRGRIEHISLQDFVKISIKNGIATVGGEQKKFRRICIDVTNLIITVGAQTTHDSKPKSNYIVDLNNIRMLNRVCDPSPKDVRRASIRFELTFKLCKFKAGDQGSQGIDRFIGINLGDMCRLTFIQNYFENINIGFFLRRHSFHQIKFNFNFLDAASIIFKHRGDQLTNPIAVESGYNSDIRDWRLHSGVYLSNNDMDLLTLTDSLHVRFRKTNKMKTLVVGDDIPEITWNPYQKFPVINSNHIEELHRLKDLFLALRNNAQIKKDNFQEIVLNRQIAQFDHQILASEGWLKSLPDRVIFGWSKFVSNYGSSWIRPLFCLLLMNVIIAIIGIKISCDADCSVWDPELPRIVVDLFIPFGSVLGVFGLGESHDGQLGFSILNVTHKALYAALLYEIIKSFRRFARRENN